MGGRAGGEAISAGGLGFVSPCAGTVESRWRRPKMGTEAAATGGSRLTVPSSARTVRTILFPSAARSSRRPDFNSTTTRVTGSALGLPCSMRTLFTPLRFQSMERATSAGTTPGSSSRIRSGRVAVEACGLTSGALSVASTRTAPWLSARSSFSRRTNSGPDRKLEQNPVWTSCRGSLRTHQWRAERRFHSHSTLVVRQVQLLEADEFRSRLRQRSRSKGQHHHEMDKRPQEPTPSLREKSEPSGGAWLSAPAVLVTLIAIHAVVDVPAHALVLRICVLFRMAVGALEDAVVVRIGVAGRAHAIGAAMIHIEPGVIEHGAGPAGG